MMLRYRSAAALHRLNNIVAKPWNASSGLIRRMSEGKMRPNRFSDSATEPRSRRQEMRFVKRYRRLTTARALKPWTPVFTLDGHEVTTAFAKGRL
jgi:hypothetical protein